MRVGKQRACERDDTQVVGNILVCDNLKTTRDIVDGNGLMNHKLEWLLVEVAGNILPQARVASSGSS